MGFVVMAFVGGLMLHNVDTSLPLGIALIHVGFIYLFIWIMVIPHELGHALAGSILSFRVFHVIIGFGRTIFVRNLLGCEWDIRHLSIGGVTVTASRSPRFYRFRFFIVVLAGPLVNAFFVVVPFWVATRGNNINQFGFWQASMLVDFAAANAISLVSTLWPRKIATIAGITDNDGLLLLTIPFKSEKVLEQRLAGYYVLASQALYRRKDYAQAARPCEVGIAHYPNCGILRMRLGVCLLSMNEFDKAREVLMEALKATDVGPEHRLILLSNIALADVLSGRKDLLEEADRHSAQAYQNIPWVRGVRVTRGKVQVESGQIAQGLALLRQSILEQTDPEIKADIAAYMAIGERRQGNIERAVRYLDITRTLDPNAAYWLA
jgi:Flp pilus assembly protein TadD